MDEMLYDDKLAGVLEERFRTKHESFTSEINDLLRRKGGISQTYQQKYSGGHRSD